MAEDSQAFVTLATDDQYGLGALVLAHSLRCVETKHRIIVLVTPDLSLDVRSKMDKVFDLVIEVNVMNSNDEANLSLMARPELGVTFTKLYCWKLTQFSKCVFLDADTMVLQNCDELFEREELSAAPDIGWPDCFNSGVFVFKPSDKTFQELLKLAVEEGSFDGGDQGLLNTYFFDWATKSISRHLPFIYNMSTTAGYAYYMPAHKKFGKNTRIVHFLGTMKPWMHRYNEDTGYIEPYKDSPHSTAYLKMWWDLFVKHVGGELNDPVEEGALLENISELSIQSTELSHSNDLSTVSEEFSSASENRKIAWEQGQVDYLGADSFQNIQRKLDEVINSSTK